MPPKVVSSILTGGLQLFRGKDEIVATLTKVREATPISARLVSRAMEPFIAY